MSSNLQLDKEVAAALTKLVKKHELSVEDFSSIKKQLFDKVNTSAIDYLDQLDQQLSQKV